MKRLINLTKLNSKTTWMNLKIIMQSKISQLQKSTSNPPNQTQPLINQFFKNFNYMLNKEDVCKRKNTEISNLK